MNNAAKLDVLVAAFEQSWNDSPPNFSDYLCKLQTLPAVVSELAIVDMELRWKYDIPLCISPDKMIDRPRLSHYRELASNHLPPQWSAEMIAEEYRIRKRFGDAPSIESYLNDFPVQRNQLTGLLPRIDQQLASDRDDLYIHPAVLPATVSDPRAPLASSDYLIQKHLATGGSSRVYRAWQNSLQRHVAVKVLRKKFQQEGLAIERLLNEARALANLRHPNIVAVHGMGRFPNGVYFLVMDYVRGRDLQAAIACEKFSLEHIYRLAQQLATAMGYAHRQGIVHRDLKPANILLDENGDPYITDFGLATTSVSTSNSIPGSPERDYEPAGTPKFMAPEQWEGGVVASQPTVDIFGLGRTIEAILNESFEDPHLLAIIRKCTAHDPQQRFPDCDSLLDNLRSR